MSQNDNVFVNGLDAETGTYLMQADVAALARVIRGEATDAELQAMLRSRKRHDQFAQAVKEGDASKGHLGTVAGVDSRSLAEAGWGVIFAHDADPEVRDALHVLLELRREQCGGSYEQGGRYREFTGLRAYRPGESAKRFVERHGASVENPVDPRKIPYYLLIVGSPEQIPFRFQYQLDVQFAVGRIYFENRAEYTQYALAVAAAETGSNRRNRRATFFGVRNQNDPATEASSQYLVQPLFEKIRADKPDWQPQLVPPEAATQAELLNLLGKQSQTAPALLFAAGHGLKSAGPEQLARQGALVCGDWPGPLLHHGPIPPEFYVAAEHIADDADLAGMVGFFFACYGAGTPMLDDFDYLQRSERRPIAEQSFLARLPQRMLSHPNGGALAVVGHVERAWGVSFQRKEQAQIEAFQSTLDQLLDGYPVGAALEFFNQRYAALSSELTSVLSQPGRRVADHELVALWTANNDARGYIVIGDPAVRLRLDAPAAADFGTLGTAHIDALSPPNPVDGAIRTAVQAADRQWQKLVNTTFHALTELMMSRPEQRLQLVGAMIAMLAANQESETRPAGSPARQPAAGGQVEPPAPAQIFTLAPGDTEVAGDLPGGWLGQPRFSTGNRLMVSTGLIPDVCWRGRLHQDPQVTGTGLEAAGQKLQASRAALPQLRADLEAWLADPVAIDEEMMATVEQWCLQQVDSMIGLPDYAPSAAQPDRPPVAVLPAYVLRNLRERRVAPGLAEWRNTMRMLRSKFNPLDRRQEFERRSFAEQPAHFRAVQWLAVEMIEAWEAAVRQMQVFLERYTRIVTRKADAREPEPGERNANMTPRRIALDLLAVTGVNVLGAAPTAAERAAAGRAVRMGGPANTAPVWDEEARQEAESFVAISDIDWRGNVMTDWRSDDLSEMTAHRQLVELALETRVVWLEWVTIALQGASRLAERRELPAGAELAPAMVWRVIEAGIRDQGSGIRD
jgi:hypothetical protein